MGHLKGERVKAFSLMEDKVRIIKGEVLRRRSIKLIKEGEHYVRWKTNPL
jgi:hypothetical protein